MKQSFVLSHDEARRRAVQAVQDAPQGYAVIVKPPTRNLEQNAKFHALCTDIEKAGITWAGKPRTAQQWKILLISGHAMATGEGSEVLPGIEGEFVNVRESSALMSKKRSSSLIEYAQAFLGASNVL